MINEFFTGESVSVEVNEKGDFEDFKEKSDKEKQEIDEQLDTTDMPELQSEESAAERRNQPGEGLKILTTNQMFSRLPTTLAQLKAGNNSEKLKMKLDNYCILCIDQRNLQSNSIKVWLTLFKNGNNLYEH